MVAINFHMMEAGLRFLLHPNVSYLLAAFGLAPLQIHPDGWLNVLSLFTWLGCFRLYRIPMPAEVNFVFTLTEMKNKLYLKTRQGGTFFNGIPSKHHTWHRKWFFVDGAWRSLGVEDNSDIDVPTTFGHKPSRKDFQICFDADILI